MTIYNYHDGHMVRIALINKTGRKYLTLIVIKGGRLQKIRVLKSETEYLQPVDMGKRQQRMAAATLRKMAKAPGTSAVIRDTVQAALS